MLFLNALGVVFEQGGAFNLVCRSPFLKMCLDKAARVKSAVIEDHVLWGRNA